MARRNDHTREVIMEMAIKAGKKIIDKEGVAGFSARGVAKAIGYTVGTLYNVFTTHENLILHINAATLSVMKEFMTSRVSNKKVEGDIDYIKALAKFYIDFAYEHYNSWSALFEFSLPQDTLLPGWYTKKVYALFVLMCC